MLTIPPHTSNCLQPLDKSVYGPFKTYYSTALDRLMRSNPGKTASIPLPGPAHACASPSDIDSHPNHAGYVSPTEILALPKSQQPRKQTNRKRVKTRILTDTPEKQAIECAHEERKSKQKGKTEKKKQWKAALRRVMLPSHLMTLLSMRAPAMKEVNQMSQIW